MKVRVYQLARELKITPDALMEMVQELGGEVKNQKDNLDESIVEQVRQQIAKEKSGRAGARPAASRAKARAATPPARPPASGETATTTATPPPTPSAPQSPPPTTAPPEKTVTPKSPARPSTPPSSKPPVPKAPPKTPPAGGAPAGRPGPRSTSRSGEPGGRASAGSRGRDSRSPATGSGGPTGAGAAGSSGRGQSMAPQDTGQAPLGPSRTPHVGSSNPSRVGLPATRQPLSRNEKRKRKKKRQASQEEIRANVKRTLAGMDGARGRKGRRRRGGAGDMAEADAGPIRIHEYATVAEIASVMEVKPAEVIGACLQMGMIVNINRQLEREEIELILAEFGHEAEFVTEYGEEKILEEEVAAEEHHPVSLRAPIVTVMGHVDHGKTTLLDQIRETRVTESESGGITQHIGAYRVETSRGPIAFLDTPGHEAFTAMRARGAKVTDLVILVVAANDEVRPQTIEAINHAKAAEVPLVVAINKIDVNGANPDNIRKGLSNAGVLVESWGGKVVDVEVAAKFGTNIDKLLELVALEAELLELTAAPDRVARGTVVESRRDSGKGIVATVLVQDGTLRVGDAFVCGQEFGRVRAMTNDHGQRVESAGPSTPVEVLGWSGVPMAGDSLAVMRNENKAREIATHRAQIARAHQHRLSRQRTTLYSVHERIQAGELQDFNIILKADVAGSVEVLRDTLENLSTAEIKVRVIHLGVGQISEVDVNLAMASGAVIIGFHTKVDSRAQHLAQTEGVDIHLYEVIYDVEKEIKAAMSGLLAPEDVERQQGTAEVRQVFKISRLGTIAGSIVRSGNIHRNHKARVRRGDQVLYEGTINSLKRHKDDVREVASGFECGIGLENFENLQEGDIIEAYIIEQVARTIE